MTAPRPRRPRAPARRSVSSLFFAIGCVVVLAAMFALGVAAGRRWPDGLPLPGFRGAPTGTAAARAERDARRPEARGLDRDKVKTRTDTPPVLTFYHELTAPLTPPPTRTAAKADRAEAKTADTAKPASRSVDPFKPAGFETAPTAETVPHDVDGPRPGAALPAPAQSEPRFTVQVGAFKVRAQAEALRARLAESGQDTHVSEVEIAGTPQYRVQVGVFATREAAREAAARLGSERRLSTYVTTR